MECHAVRMRRADAAPICASALLPSGHGSTRNPNPTNPRFFVPSQNPSGGPSSSTCSSQPRSRRTRPGCRRWLPPRARPSQTAPSPPPLQGYGGKGWRASSGARYGRLRATQRACSGMSGVADAEREAAFTDTRAHTCELRLQLAASGQASPRAELQRPCPPPPTSAGSPRARAHATPAPAPTPSRTLLCALCGGLRVQAVKLAAESVVVGCVVHRAAALRGRRALRPPARELDRRCRPPSCARTLEVCPADCTVDLSRRPSPPACTSGATPSSASISS